MNCDYLAPRPVASPVENYSLTNRDGNHVVKKPKDVSWGNLVLILTTINREKQHA